MVIISIIYMTSSPFNVCDIQFIFPPTLSSATPKKSSTPKSKEKIAVAEKIEAHLPAEGKDKQTNVHDETKGNSNHLESSHM